MQSGILNVYVATGTLLYSSADIFTTYNAASMVQPMTAFFVYNGSSICHCAGVLVSRDCRQSCVMGRVAPTMLQKTRSVATVAPRSNAAWQLCIRNIV